MTYRWTQIDDYTYSVVKYLMNRHGIDRAYQTAEPLLWYIRTGRASVQFMKQLVTVRPYVIGRLLEKGGSYDETIARIKNRAGKE